MRVPIRLLMSTLALVAASACGGRPGRSSSQEQPAAPSERPPVCGFLEENVDGSGLLGSFDRIENGACCLAGLDWNIEQGDVCAPRATSAFEAACSQGDLASCVSLGNNLASVLNQARDDPRAVELYDRACQGGDRRGCMAIAGMQYVGRGTALDPASAQETLAGLCSEGISDACDWLATIRFNQRREDEAAQILGAACEAGGWSACSGLGWLYRHGKRVDRDAAATADLLRRSCDAGSLAGCVELGNMILDQNGTSESAEEAEMWFRDACYRGDGSGCRALADLLWWPADDSKRSVLDAVAFYTRACDLEDTAGCNAWARRARRGAIRYLIQPTLAGEVLRRSCDLGDPEGCAQLVASAYEGGLAIGEPVAGTAAEYGCARMRDLLEAYCADGAPGYCVELASLILGRRMGEGVYCPAVATGESGSVEAVERDEARAVDLLRQACSVGEEDGCIALATADRNLDQAGTEEMLAGSCGRGAAAACDMQALLIRGRALLAGEEPDMARVTALRRQACDGGDSVACDRLAAQYVAGDGLDADASMARSLLTDSCIAGSASACGDLGWLLLDGQGGSADPSGAERLFRRGCDAADTRSCLDLVAMEMNQTVVECGTDDAIWILDRVCRLAGPFADDEDCRHAKMLKGALYLAGGIGCMHVVGDLAQGIELLTQACFPEDNRDVIADACHVLSIEYERGVRVSADAARAAALRARACSFGDEELSCPARDEAAPSGGDGPETDGGGAEQSAP